VKRTPIRRKSPLKRGTKRLKRTPLKRSSKLKRSRLATVGRRKAKLRKLQFGPQSERCRRMPCSVPGCQSGTPIEAHHVVPRSRGGKDSDTVPLCAHHRYMGHYIGWWTFEERFDVDLASIARELGE